MRLNKYINESNAHEDFYNSLMRMFKNWKRKDIFTWEVKSDLKSVVAALEIMKPSNVVHTPATDVSNDTYLFEFPRNNIVTAFAKTSNTVHVQRLSYKDFRKYFK